MRSKTRIIIAAVLAPTGLAIAAVLYAPHWHPSDSRFPIQGIDVSHHQGPIDWAKLPGQGVDFAYLKASEGGDFRDQQFEENWRNASAAGIKRGAYHFFTLCRGGAEQAANFIAAVPKDEVALPPAVDLEYLGNCDGRPSPAQLRREVAVFLGTVERHYGQKAVLYLTPQFDEAFAIGAHFDRPIWWRKLVLEPRLDGRSWTIWQASNFRRLDGIEGRVDWNVVDLTSAHAPSLHITP
jgi:lysozyme